MSADNLRLAASIDHLLPQTQCRRCGYEGCRPYADAVANGESIDRCPPGGAPLLQALAAVTGRPLPADTTIDAPPEPLVVARIVEAQCIGCTLCIQACPVDAIVGATKQMHTVISALCSGCRLCVPACPVDCIVMPPAGRAWTGEDAGAARTRYEARNRRLADHEGQRHPVKTHGVAADVVGLAESERRAYVAAARHRAQVRRASPKPAQ